MNKLWWLLLAVPIPLQLFAAEADLDNGAEINEVCAGCHGEFGEGGKDGEYPRLAGLPASYMEKQLHLFRDRKRPNMPMLEYIDERQFPDQEITDISAYLEQIELLTQLPPVTSESDFDAYDRMMMTKKLLNIARLEGDIKAGEKLYKRECRTCHGRKAEGKMDKGIPMLAGQYSKYLNRQFERYRKKQRIHDEEDLDNSLLSSLSQQQLDDLLAYLSILDD